jgi:hypothetical protein
MIELTLKAKHVILEVRFRIIFFAKYSVTDSCESVPFIDSCGEREREMSVKKKTFWVVMLCRLYRPGLEP